MNIEQFKDNFYLNVPLIYVFFFFFSRQGRLKTVTHNVNLQKVSFMIHWRVKGCDVSLMRRYTFNVTAKNQ